MAQTSESELRMTRQRQAILEVLRRSAGHLTGDEIYRLARRRLPHISLGTVYRNLEVLSDGGLIGKVEMAGAPRHFDVTVGPHYHIRCLRCGKVEDLPLPSLAALEQQAQAATGYQVVAHQLELAGFCPRCRKLRRSPAGNRKSRVESRESPASARTTRATAGKRPDLPGQVGRLGRPSVGLPKDTLSDAPREGPRADKRGGAAPREITTQEELTWQSPRGRRRSSAC